jgi:hypothetical protein
MGFLHDGREIKKGVVCAVIPLLIYQILTLIALICIFIYPVIREQYQLYIDEKMGVVYGGEYDYDTYEHEWRSYHESGTPEQQRQRQAESYIEWYEKSN